MQAQNQRMQQTGKHQANDQAALCAIMDRSGVGFGKLHAQQQIGLEPGIIAWQARNNGSTQCFNQHLADNPVFLIWQTGFEGRYIENQTGFAEYQRGFAGNERGFARNQRVFALAANGL
jgi:hypothetical protein